MQLWPKGVDTELFHPSKRAALGYAAPVFLYVGRVAVEKNIEAFLRLDLPGAKVIVGGGPSLEQLRVQYPAAVFLGPKTGEELAQLYASADAFVFPSRTDTFGLVLLEALASGTPVAAYPVAGPIDVIGTAPVGALDEDLRKAALAALEIPRELCRGYATQFSWAASTDAFLMHLPVVAAEGQPADQGQDGRAGCANVRRMSRRFLALALLAVAGPPATAIADETTILQGRAIVELYCADCHATGPTGESPLPDAPRFRDLHLLYDVEFLSEALVEGIVTAHPEMPEFEFDPGRLAPSSTISSRSSRTPIDGRP